MKRFTFRAAVCGVMSAISLIAFTLENLLPPLIIPGARLGLSNIFILLTALLVGGAYGYAALAVKTLIGSIIIGNFSAVLYSLPAGIIALTLELTAILYFRNVGIIAASVLGSVINITVQNAVFCLVTKTTEYFIYSPYLALIGTFTGAIVGLIVHKKKKKFPYGFLGLNQ